MKKHVHLIMGIGIGLIATSFHPTFSSEWFGLVIGISIVLAVLKYCEE